MTRMWYVIAATLLAPAIASAFTINGTVINGTTGAPATVTVHVVRPSGGMVVEQEIEARDGHFTIGDLDKNAPIYLIRIDYQGVMYNEPVRVTGGDVDVTVKIYEVTTSWEHLHVSSPSLIASRTGDVLEIERIYDVVNETDPPRTVAGDEASFSFVLPADMVELKSSHVTAIGVPIARTPVPVGENNLHKIDYPLRPGLTRVSVTYTVPYSGGSYTLRERVPYDVENITVFQIDPDMDIAGGGVEFDVHNSTNSMNAYHATNVAGDTEITIAFSGGTSEPAGATTADSGSRTGSVMLLPNAMEETSIIIMVIMLLALLALAGVSVHGVESPLEQRDGVQAHYETLARRLARLDDLHAAETIPADVYPVKRAELKQQLASLRYRLEKSQRASGEDGQPTDDISRNVAGEEQTSTT